MEVIREPYRINAKRWRHLTRVSVDLAINQAAIKCGFEAESFFQDSFKDHGFIGDRGFVAWRKRKRQYSWPILNKTGQLMDSMTVTWRKTGPIRRSTVRTAFSKFRPLPDDDMNKGPLRVYAAFHNQPDNTYKYPYPNIQRQFMGHSKVLDEYLSSVLMESLALIAQGIHPLF